MHTVMNAQSVVVGASRPTSPFGLRGIRPWYLLNSLRGGSDNTFQTSTIVHLQKYLDMHPRSAIHHAKLGALLLADGDLEGGFGSLVTAFQLDSLCPGVKDGFRRYYSMCIAKDANDIDAYEGLAVLHQDSGSYGDAAVCLARCLELQPNPGRRGEWWQATLLKCRAAVCDWRFWEEDTIKLKELVRRDNAKGVQTNPSPPLVHPFDALSLPLDPSDLRGLSEQYAACFDTDRLAVSTSASAIRPKEATHIRLGYVSGDFMASHPLLQLMKSVFSCHNKDRFEIFIYALNGDDGSDARARIESAATVFRDLSQATAEEAADLIKADGCDILINLGGYAGTRRCSEIFCQRPAPLAVSYMGFPGTMGAKWIDYMIADSVVIPPKQRQHYSEAIIYVPHSYFVNDYRQCLEAQKAVSAPLPSRADHGLPEDAVVLCNFNRLHKLDPNTFKQWTKVLEEVPSAVLWLLYESEEATANLRAAAAREGIEPHRLVFAPIVPRGEHLLRLRLADLFVDSALYNAHTLGCDALWAAVPLVTLAGETMAARVAASLLKAVGLPGLVTASMEKYGFLITALAQDVSCWRRKLHTHLKKGREYLSLWDTAQWVKDMEAGLERAWAIHSAGDAPQDVIVSDLERT